MLGLYDQQRTGQGQFMRTSMIGGNALAYSDDFCTYEGKPPIAICDDEAFGVNALYRLYEAAEGWICLAATTDREWRSLVDAIGEPGLAVDERFATGASRLEHDAQLVDVLRAVFRTRPAAEWEIAPDRRRASGASTCSSRATRRSRATTRRCAPRA